MDCEQVGVVILNYNDIDNTLECLRSVGASRYACIQSVVVVDNCSEKACVKRLRSELDGLEGITLLPLHQNLGFAAGMNRGIAFVREKGAKYVLVLNNDTVLEPECIKYMVRATHRSASVGIVSPKIRRYDDPHILDSAGSVERLQFAASRGVGHLDVGQFDKPEKCTFASGCAMLITDRALTKIGAFDERFFFGCEDRELSLRCTKSGLDIWYEPHAVVYHKKGQARKKVSDAERVYLGQLTQLFYIKVSRPKLRWLIWYALYLIHYATVFPIRLTLHSGVNRGMFRCLGGAWSAWIEAHKAKKALPRAMWGTADFSSRSKETSKINKGL